MDSTVDANPDLISPILDNRDRQGKVWSVPRRPKQFENAHFSIAFQVGSMAQPFPPVRIGPSKSTVQPPGHHL